MTTQCPKCGGTTWFNDADDIYCDDCGAIITDPALLDTLKNSNYFDDDDPDDREIDAITGMTQDERDNIG